jgi:hypothetical protein
VQSPASSAELHGTKTQIVVALYPFFHLLGFLPGGLSTFQRRMDLLPLETPPVLEDERTIGRGASS